MTPSNRWASSTSSGDMSATVRRAWIRSPFSSRRSCPFSSVSQIGSPSSSNWYPVPVNAPSSSSTNSAMTPASFRRALGSTSYSPVPFITGRPLSW